MKWLTRLFTLPVCLAGTALFAQKPVPADPCNVKPEAKAGSSAATDFFPFDRFDKELRSALKSKDAVAMAFLVKFPLRINDAGGTISIDDAQALKTHFDEIFTPAVSKQILGDTQRDAGCSAEGIMYGSGAVWVEPTYRGYSIAVVNRDEPDTPSASKSEINFVCQTPKNRVVIDTPAGQAIRYRAWKKPKPLTDQPDLEISKGEQTFEGHDVCAVPLYTFKNASTIYTVYAGMGCDAEHPPADAKGSLEVSVGDKILSSTWCY